EARPGMARLLPDGSLDASFAPAANLSGVKAYADSSWIATERTFVAQPNSPVLATINRIVRVLPDGSLAPDFVFDHEPEHIDSSYILSRSQWWGRRADGALLV